MNGSVSRPITLLPDTTSPGRTVTRTEAIVRIGLGVVGLAAVIPRGRIGSLGCDERTQRDRSREHDLGDEHFHLTSPCTVG